MIADQLAQLVEGQQQNADHLRRGNHLAGADQVERVLGLVRQFADLDQIEEAGAPLDGMGGAEDAIHQLLVDLRAALLDGQQVRLDGGQVLAAFGQIILYQFVVQIRLAHRMSPQFPDTLKCWCMRIDRNSSRDLGGGVDHRQTGRPTLRRELCAEISRPSPLESTMRTSARSITRSRTAFLDDSAHLRAQLGNQ